MKQRVLSDLDLCTKIIALSGDGKCSNDIYSCRNDCLHIHEQRAHRHEMFFYDYLA
jgi:hypothetical protein